MRGEIATRKYFWYLFFCDYDFTIVTGDGLVSGFRAK